MGVLKVVRQAQRCGGRVCAQAGRGGRQRHARPPCKPTRMPTTHPSRPHPNPAHPPSAAGQWPARLLQSTDSAPRACRWTRGCSSRRCAARSAPASCPLPRAAAGPGRAGRRGVRWRPTAACSVQGGEGGGVGVVRQVCRHTTLPPPPLHPARSHPELVAREPRALLLLLLVLLPRPLLPPPVRGGPPSLQGRGQGRQHAAVRRTPLSQHRQLPAGPAQHGVPCVMEGVAPAASGAIWRVAAGRGGLAGASWGLAAGPGVCVRLTGKECAW